jgi:hypothetical protein
MLWLLLYYVFIGVLAARAVRAAALARRRVGPLTPNVWCWHYWITLPLLWAIVVPIALTEQVVDACDESMD